MSKEAMGQNGALLGSSSYWERVNRATFLGGLMRQSGNWGYWETLREVGNRANSAVEEIHQDLQEKAGSIRMISDGRRNSLEKLARGLYDVCRMSGGTASHADNCISLLQAAGAFQVGFSSGGPAAEKAVKKMKNDSRFFTSECVELVEKAAEWGIGFAAGSDKHKREFLENVAQGKGKPFFQEVLETYKSTAKPTDLRGRCGYEIGSSDYLTQFERSVFGQDLPAQSSVRWGSPGYTALLRDSLEHILGEVERDLEYNLRENHYITDATAEVLRAAARELARCGVGGMLDGKIERLAWFVGGDPAKIRQLQSKLNQLGAGERLTEDGVYGKNTLNAWNQFTKTLVSGSVPTLGFINPLQSDITGITHEVIASGWKPSGAILNHYPMTNLPDQYSYSIFFQTNEAGKHPIFRLDRPHFENGQPLPYHMNVDMDVPPFAQKYFYNHKEISEEAFLKLKNFQSVSKVVRIAGKVLLVTGVALDALELGTSIDADLKDADGKLGKTTLTTAASIGGRWAGAALGAKSGAALGAAIGTAVFPVIGTAIGGAVFGLIGGGLGSMAGESIADAIVDITCMGE